MKISQVKIGAKVICKYTGYYYNEVGTIKKIIPDSYCQFRIIVEWDNLNLIKTGYWGNSYFELLFKDDGLICKKKM